MKKIKKLTTVLFVSIFTFGFSQEEKPIVTTTTTVTTSTVSSNTIPESKKVEVFSRKNELRLDATYLIFGAAFNISYESIISNESGLGVTLIISNGKELNTKFVISPYYRYYFGKKPATGFYFEGFAMYSSFNAQEYVNKNNNNNFFFGDTKTVTISDLAIGFGLGGKWMTNNGIIFELGFGVGRNLLNDYSNYEPGNKIAGKGGISVGYRF